MNAPETPQEFARKIGSRKIADGFKPEALHKYTNETGDLLFYRLRLRHRDGRKWIRPFHANGKGWDVGEPKFPDGKPLYRLHELATRTDCPVHLVEGENCAAALAKLGVLATTSGGASSAAAADWSPLQGRTVIVWADHDEAGCRYAVEATEKLEALGCSVRWVNVAALKLPEAWDCVDWLAAHRGATAADMERLPRIEPPAARSAKSSHA